MHVRRTRSFCCELLRCKGRHPEFVDWLSTRDAYPFQPESVPVIRTTDWHREITWMLFRSHAKRRFEIARSGEANWLVVMKRMPRQVMLNARIGHPVDRATPGGVLSRAATFVRARQVRRIELDESQRSDRASMSKNLSTPSRAVNPGLADY